MRLCCWRRLVLCLAMAAPYACEEPKPAVTGRMQGPSDLVFYQGCPEDNPACNLATEATPIMLMANSLGNELRVFDAKGRRFFEAENPLFPLSIPVGEYPKSLVVDGHDEFAFVANGLSADVSVVDLSRDRMVEVDTDQDSCSSYCGNCQDADTGSFSERCRAGVSRVILGVPELVQAADIVTPSVGPDGELWNRSDPLPVYVSMPASGNLARLEFQYPDPDSDQSQRMELTEMLDLGGLPAGMALTRDGKVLYLADEDSEDIIVIDTESMAVERVFVDGRSTELALTPDESVLYVIHLDESKISLVDTASRVLRPAGASWLDASDPGSASGAIQLPGIAKSITFVQGVPRRVNDETGQDFRDYTNELLRAVEEEEIKQSFPEFESHLVLSFAYVSNLDGRVYLIDAENHRLVDVNPWMGTNIVGQPVLTIGGNNVSAEELLTACMPSAVEEEGEEVEESVAALDCPYPLLVGYGTRYAVPEEIETITCSDHGTATLDADGQPFCDCEEGFVAMGMECHEEGMPELFRNYYGILLRPGVTIEEGWIFTYGGVLRGTEKSSSGRLSAWRLDDDRLGLDFLAARVEPGDSLEIMSEPLDDNDQPFIFKVAEVQTKSLVLVAKDGFDLEQLWPEAVRYRVRVNNAWTVWGLVSGAMPRIHMVPFQEEALETPAYDNGLIALTMFAPEPDPETGAARSVPRDSTWGFNIDDGFSMALYAPSIRVGASGALAAVDVDEELAEEEGEEPLVADDRVYLLYEGSNAMLEFFPDNLEPSSYILYQ